MDHLAAGASSWFIGSSTHLVQPMARPGTGYNRFAMENRLPRICWTSLSHWNMLILEILRVYEHHFWRQPPKPSGHQCQGTERKAVNMALMSICSSGKNLLAARGLEKNGGETWGNRRKNLPVNHHSPYVWTAKKLDLLTPFFRNTLICWGECSNPPSSAWTWAGTTNQPLLRCGPGATNIQQPFSHIFPLNHLVIHPSL